MGIVEFEQTPNPDALRVRSGRMLTNGAPLEFGQEDEADHPLVAELLAIEGVERIMVARDFVTVVRSGPRVAWEPLRPLIVLALIDSSDAGPIRSRPPATTFTGEVEQHIEDVLDRYVRHLLAADGGEAVLVSFDAEDGTAWANGRSLRRLPIGRHDAQAHHRANDPALGARGQTRPHRR